MSISYIRPDMYRYPSRRSDVFARNMVVTSQPLAAEAGLHVLRNGGNAVDAALAAAICLTVVEPTGNGIGSDAFAIVYNSGRLFGFNGSGRSPTAWSLERFAHHQVMPDTGWESVTVPGAVDAWVQLSKRFGRIPFAELFEPAIHYARSGYAVTPIVQGLWSRSIERYLHLDGFRDTFTRNGSAPEVGELFQSPGHAASLEEIARTGGDSFYRGALAEAIVADAGHHGAVMAWKDLADHAGCWVDTVSTRFGSLEVHEIPPNGQGLAALIALGVLSCLDLGERPVDSADALHLQIEAMKLAQLDAADHIAEPAHMRISPEELLDADRFRELARRIDPFTASEPSERIDADHGTVYLCAGDENGTMVSMIQSNYQGFGSGVVVPGTGISMQNRGAGFSLNPRHCNCVGGGKRPFHTIIPAFLMRGGEPAGTLGVMGGHMQPQGHVQIVCRIEVWGQGLQEAVDAPRWFVDKDFNIHLEAGIDAEIAAELAKRGHRIVTDPAFGTFGGAQALLKSSSGYRGASDPRKDGLAAGF